MAKRKPKVVVDKKALTESVMKECMELARSRGCELSVLVGIQTPDGFVVGPIAAALHVSIKE